MQGIGLKTSGHRSAGPKRDGAHAIVLIGVSGCGKSTVGRLLAAALGASFIEGDAYHASSAIAKMRAGIPLDDRDRWPWLGKLGAAILRHRGEGRAVVVACSALKRAYRERLDTATRLPLTFVHLSLDPANLEHRLRARRQHFMPATLLESQLAALEPLEADENGTTIVERGTARQTVADIQRWLRGQPLGVGPHLFSQRKKGGRSHPFPKITLT